ncbi:MAG: FAD-dependent oxidoreductase [Pseudomonadota bacterium]
MKQALPRQTDIVVIGGGMAGLSAASRLHQCGVEVRLIEAQARVGGRVYSEKDDHGQPIELGAQAFNRDMRILARAARTHGLQRAPLHHQGKVVFDGIEQAQAKTAIERLEALLDGNDPEFNALAGNPDSSLADAVDLLSPDDQSRQMMDSYVQELWGRPMDRLQLAHAVEISKRFDSSRDDWEFQLVEGFGALAERMAATLGDRLVLGAPVTRIEAQPEEVTVTSLCGSIRTKAAIIAVPPTVARHFMPDQHWSQNALSTFEAGDLIKVVVQYDETFWRRKGYSGESISVKRPGFATADGTLADGGRPTLLVFIGGVQARAISALSSEQRRLRIRSILITLFGEAAGNPTGWYERNWIDEPWVGGAYTAHVSPGTMLEPDAVLRRFESGITFACAEIAARFPGYVEGAMQEGWQAAERVLSGLNHAVEAKPSEQRLWSRFKRALGA